MVSSTPIATRGMGGFGIGYVDYDPRYDFKMIYPHSQTLNFLNPASYAKLKITSFDIGLELQNQVLKQQNDIANYKASYANISYVQLGIPLSRKRNIAMVLGLRPISRVNYQVLEVERAHNPETGNPIDSVLTSYQGNGGSYQAYMGLAKAFKNLSIGVQGGYYFGSKDLTTRKEMLNDSVFYYKGNFESKSNFGGLFVQGGLQYSIRLNSNMRLVLGATGTIKNDFNAHRDQVAETFVFDAANVVIPVDTVYSNVDQSGKVTFPASYGVGFTLERQDKWLFGVDFQQTNWDDYRFFGEKDSVASNWKIKAGGQFVPNAFGTNYWGRVSYRFGFNYGPDYISLNGKTINEWAGSLGFGFPVRPNRFSNQYTNINLALEYGRRGDNTTKLQENQFRLSLGFTLSDLWFVKKKYD
ncbi:hypothetical protein [Flavihumibacter petaseus]|uniref:Outer membrane protein n=1 Tax=Flavihumibacter petaseus NBRC 106054 TaxID=1220578 RepID=A0A0E9MY63_9BACT|nr:hypothetical protein [Flavihumibacter petaseus]GAO42070.1 hypothetical protein FPE01S_01_10830 [Flavihumibacter petaseus NBRC 106054]